MSKCECENCKQGLNKLSDKEFNILKSNYYDVLEPYQYFEFYNKLVRKKYFNKDLDEITLFKNIKNNVSLYSFNNSSKSIDLKENKIIRFDDDLLPLLEDTTPCFDNLKLKYPSIFINHKFIIGDFIVMGCLLIDVDEIIRFHPEISIIKEEKNLGGKIVYGIALNVKEKYEIYFNYYLCKNDYRVSVDLNKHGIDLSNKIINISCNFLNFLLNDEKDIEYVTVTPTNNEKRLKRGKMLKREVTFIRLNGVTKRYAQYYKTFRNKSNVRYFVGGFWRKLNSPYFKNKRGQVVYVKPFYKNMDAEFENIPRYAEVSEGKKCH